jgi:hypothetical protein
LSVASIFEVCKAYNLPAYVLALDISKAYDSVDRLVLDEIMAHIGIANNKFYALM